MSLTLGQRLKKEREARYLSLEKAAEETRIRAVFLQALEADDYSAMPSAAQGRGFLRNYADYLGLNLSELIAEIQQDPPPQEVSGPLPEVNLAEGAPPIELQTEAPTPNLRERATALLQKFAPPEKMLEAIRSRLGDFFRHAEKTLPVEEEAEVLPPPEPLREKAPALPADQILAEIGAHLRQRRELISLTVEEVERHTKLRAGFIRALEAGDAAKLPSPVQTGGMLNNYAAFLDLDADKLLLRFAEALQARRREKYADTPLDQVQTQVQTSMPFWRSFIAGDLVFGFLIIAALAGLAIWGVSRVVDSQSAQSAQPTAPSISDVLSESLPTESVSLTFVPVNEGVSTPTPADLQALDATPTSATTANITVNLLALERVFLRVAVDGKIAFEGRLSPGETKLFEANEQVQVLTGNAAALRVTYNGADLGLMGSAGEAISRVYLINGVATPTATVSPTPTNTPLVTNTPTPTLTPSFTPPSP
ncbi:MAG: hypothetical protein Fur002_03480 [Anaerolineales bacterium]